MPLRSVARFVGVYLYIYLLRDQRRVTHLPTVREGELKDHGDVDRARVRGVLHEAPGLHLAHYHNVLPYMDKRALTL